LRPFYKPSDEPQGKTKLSVCRGCRILMLQCTVVCRQDKMDITYFVPARPLPFFFLNIIFTIADITVLGRHISVFCLDGRVTGAEKVKKRRERGARGRRNRKILILRKCCITMRQKLPASRRVAMQPFTSANDASRRFSF